MRRYETAWSILAAMLTGLSAVVIVEQVGWGAVLAATVAISVMAAVLSYSWRESFGPGGGSVLAWTVGSGAGIVLFIGLPLAFGRGGPLVLLLLAVSAPPVVRLLRRRVVVPPPPDRRPRTTPASEQVPATRPRPLSPMSDPRLSPAWLDTERRMRHANFEETLQIVAERERLLDEFEERDPEGFHAWLASSPPRSA